jgi:hypothetical protein
MLEESACVSPFPIFILWNTNYYLNFSWLRINLYIQVFLGLVVTITDIYDDPSFRKSTYEASVAGISI